MNIVFFGSSQFAVPSLKALITSGHKISCVVTKPDRQKGRGLHLEGTAVKSISLESGLNIYQPQRINTPEGIKFLKQFNPDLFVVIAYGQILSQGILDIPEIFSINIHGSLLPKYRGAAPINWAIINGEKTTGITIIKMTKNMDAGPIILQKIIDIDESDTSITLEYRLSQEAAHLLIDSLKSIENNDYRLTAQDESKITFAPKLKKENGLIDWSKSAQVICNLARGCSNWPGAFTYYQERLLKIYKAKVSKTPRHKDANTPGEIIGVSKENMAVITGEDVLIIEELQIEGKRRMRIEEFIAGHKVNIGERLGYPS